MLQTILILISLVPKSERQISTKLFYNMGQVQTKNKNKNKNKNKGMQNFESKEEYFIKNGGILLKKQIALSQGQHIAAQLKILSQKEIKNATNNFDPNLIFGRNHKLIAYIGTLDDRVVFIKAPQEQDPDPELVDLFLTEASTLMVMRHDNISKIYGCCLETYIPLIVYQYSSSKNLHSYLYGDLAIEKPLKWRGCLKAATDVAYALSYMHNALSKPVVHRDVQSYIILIDSSFHAILTSFAHSVSITPGEKNRKWPVHGTPGYIDPEYIETQEVTDKCDVYSFGVLMLELLTTRDPVKLARHGKDLVIEFVSKVERNEGIKELVDRSVLEAGNMAEIQRFVQLALKCVAKKGEHRPTMINVVEELKQIQDQANNGYGCNA